MTRGKHGNIANRQKALREEETNLASYKRMIADQSAEIRALKSEAAETKERHQEAVRVLNARLAEGVSVELEASRLEVLGLRNEIGEIRATAKKMSDNHMKLTTRLHDYFRSQGMTHVEAVEKMISFLGGNTTYVPGDEARMNDADKARALQRARGERK